MGFDRTKSSGNLMNMDGRTLTGFAGLHGVWNPNPVWYLRGHITGFLSHGSHAWAGGHSEYPLNSNADVNSHGLYAALRGGYVWNIDGRNTLTPELGLDWLWTHQDAFSLHWTGGRGRGGARLPEYAMDFRAEDYSALAGTALLRWRGDFALVGGRLIPTLGLGLTGDDVQSRLRFAGSSFTTKAPADDTSALAEAGLAWTRDNVAVGLAYAGEYGSHRQSHAGRLTVRLEF